MPKHYSNAARFAGRTASTSLLALIALCVAWEIWLAPLRPGGSWLVLKALPLLFPLRGILYRRPYTYQWTSLLSLGYILEGLVRASSDTGPSRGYAAVEVIVATTLFISVIAALRLHRRDQKASAQGESKPAD